MVLSSIHHAILDSLKIKNCPVKPSDLYRWLSPQHNPWDVRIAAWELASWNLVKFTWNWELELIEQK